MKAALARLGICGFKPTLRKAPQRLDALRTPEGVPIPPNTLHEIRRDMVRHAVVREQIAVIERARLAGLEQAPASGPHAMVRLLARVVGVGMKRRTCWFRRCCPETFETGEPWPVMLASRGSPDEATREKGLAKAGNARARRGPDPTRLAVLGIPEGQRACAMVPGADGGPQGTRKTTMIVALDRKLLIALWRVVTIGEIPAASRCGS